MTRDRYVHVKRSLDAAGASLGLVLCLPLILACAAAVKLDSPGPALFRQTRLGLNGKEFTMFKLRTMTIDAERAGVYELAKDPRVTRVGRILRRTSLDELPQFLNILRGEMSFIGPRPTLTYHPWNLDEYSEDQLRRFQTRPGITGLAQITGRKELPWPERIALDVQYVETLSLTTDVTIALRTVRSVLSATGNLNTEAQAHGAK
ncbi:sugar transferase [Tessaracoccus sp. MC1756]|uniref:sugar transferase n=1 Tax=Tessaracoccus sp. MC1756 TaxID=2760311 RepID=UPI0021085BB5|nr:sugar transferase [Tessaracoccus sp. MC1756]